MLCGTSGWIRSPSRPNICDFQQFLLNWLQPSIILASFVCLGPPHPSFSSSLLPSLIFPHPPSPIIITSPVTPNNKQHNFLSLPFPADASRPHDSTEQLRNLLLMQQGATGGRGGDQGPSSQYGAPPSRQDYSQPPPADYNKYPQSTQGYGAPAQQDRYAAPNVAHHSFSFTSPHHLFLSFISLLFSLLFSFFPTSFDANSSVSSSRIILPPVPTMAEIIKVCLLTFSLFFFSNKLNPNTTTSSRTGSLGSRRLYEAARTSAAGTFP